MKLKERTLFLIVILITFGGIAIADMLGLWTTESSKIPKKIQQGVYDPGDIRGSYSFEDISQSFDVTPNKIAEAFNIVAENPEMIKVKDVEKLYGQLGEGIEIGTDSVRYFVALYTGIPYESHDILPAEAVEILYEEGKIQGDEKENLMITAVDLPKTVYDANILEEEEHIEEGFTVKGKTTVQEVLNEGLSVEELEAIIGTKIKSRGNLIKDLCLENGLPFSEIKLEIYNRISNMK